MTSSIDALLSPATPDGVTIVLGARLLLEAGELPAGAARLLIYDPDPNRAQALSTLAAGRAGVEVTAAAPAAAEGLATWYRYSFATLDGFAEAAPLREVFPGLKELGPIRVQRQAAADLAGRLEGAGGGDVLLLDLLGEEAAVLEALGAAGVLDRLARVLLRCPAQPLSPGGADAAELGARLESMGFDAGVPVEGSDPDFPLLRFARSPLFAELTGLRARLAEARARIDRLEAAQDEAAGLGKQRQARIGELEIKMKARAEEVSGLKASLKAREDEVAALKAAQRKAGTGQQSEIDRLGRELADREAKLAEKTTALRHAQAATAGLEARRDTLEADLERESGAAKAGQKAQEQMRRDLSVALRLQALREADLRDLQEQFADLAARKAAQDELLQTLTRRLDSAARYLQRIEALPAGPGTGAIAGTEGEGTGGGTASAPADGTASSGSAPDPAKAWAPAAPAVHRPRKSGDRPAGKGPRPKKRKGPDA